MGILADNSRQKWNNNISRVSCQKGPTRHAYAWQIGPFWQDTFDMCNKRDDQAWVEMTYYNWAAVEYIIGGQRGTHVNYAYKDVLIFIINVVFDFVFLYIFCYLRYCPI